MSRIFTVSFNDVAVTAKQDLFQLQAKVVPAILHGIFISQNSDVGDAESESLLIRIKRVTDAVIDSASEVKLDQGSSAANANLAVNQLTQLVTGPEIIHPENWNIALSFVWMPPPEMRIVVPVDKTVVIDMAKIPADAITMSGVLYFEEIGS